MVASECAQQCKRRHRSHVHIVATATTPAPSPRQLARAKLSTRSPASIRPGRTGSTGPTVVAMAALVTDATIAGDAVQQCNGASVEVRRVTTTGTGVSVHTAHYAGDGYHRVPITAARRPLIDTRRAD